MRQTEVQYDSNLVIKALSETIANKEVENATLKAIIEEMAVQITELETQIQEYEKGDVNGSDTAEKKNIK